MADICACQDKKCPSRTLCYRYTCEKDTHWQSYFAKSPRKPHAVSCDEFWANWKGDKTRSFDPDPSDYTVSHKKHMYGNGHKNIGKRTGISMKKYNEILTEIIKKGKPVSDTLVEMLEEASRFDITQPALRKKDNCKCDALAMSHKKNKICRDYHEKMREK